MAAAKAALPAWAALDPSERGAYLRKVGDLILKYQRDLEILDAVVMGRPIATFADAPLAATQYHYHAEAGYQAKGETSLNHKGIVSMTLRQPIGVVAAIIPWNFPIILSSQKVAPALAAGCTVVLKSSEKAPLSVRLKTILYDMSWI